MERAGLIEVTERSGAWPSIRVIFDADEAADVADTYAREGRRRTEPCEDPSHIPALRARNDRR
ncbi:hypothetical protein OG417_13780 [Actinoallomurus sp. NBC_01490]|uniref:hypothetical protein n=1 Tax=Actinoallomurus sp. NBC_01490 TaxID=2903557 RepID=UPI002E3097B5|nr:hypothetical protein [Actinoallomurus sp. NBC_01490]